MSNSTNDRKIEHIRVIEEDPDTDRQGDHFASWHLMHRALPEIDYAEVDPGVSFLGKRLSFPLLISSMTGGDHELVLRVNRNLAQAAEATGVAMGVGSQRVMFTHPESCNSFALRQWAPTTVLLGNLGAVQLNYGFGLEEAQSAINIMQADGLFLHLNPLQEAVQPEGDRNFKGLAAKIAALQAELTTPLILKEVGCGMTPADIELGLAAGIRYFDLAGSGGTSWSRIEHHRRGRGDLGLRMQDWGIPTPVALDWARPYQERATFIASGGLRNGLDMIKSVILGGSLCGLAAPLLKPAMESAEAVIAVIEGVKQEFTTAMFLLGVTRVEQLHLNDALLWRR
ncbi:isopentenyl-diphosphate delta-isomerase [Pokkaliibacter plantistimulans]|uniref:Isopentenyl-diphosphate delta-isomerase n=1 Tax=Pokkaliibacter plantistimulans TaxID=1635171 RepID=A0ABX5LWJ3_9GAMM|nr:type 2 isopentenyl-diphosphate Delta-isomerase [Pokkaliibacter plantistimulans]PXF31030.1 isopentenyl-diphosphate delta-isomerase [Pokkaliibacter plantistimulans]